MLVGQSPVMQELRSQVVRVGRTAFTVLVEGESGAGKELVAREIHARSPRFRGPFVAVNCAALVETLLEAELFGIEERTATGVRGRRGKFEQADGGTLFLDEVGDLSPTAQAKLLRVLQDMTVERVGSGVSRPVDTRVVAATNRGLHELVRRGGFRADLYYRLSGVDIVVPPLRKRRDDVPALVSHFLGRYGRNDTMAVAPAAMDALISYDWPGNVRQLGRVLERAIALAPSSLITLRDLPSEIGRWPLLEDTGAAACNLTLRAWSSRYARLVLDRFRGNKRRACDVLDISYHTLQALIAFDPPDGQDAETSDQPDLPSSEAGPEADSHAEAMPARLDPSAGE
jgi:transcriptional regulator with PAS, ATPase and Fis domain